MKFLKFCGYVLVGLVPVAALAGLVYFLYLWAGSVGRLAGWFLGTLLGSVLTTLVVAGLHEMGVGIWRALDIPHKLYLRKLDKQHAKQAKLDAKKQDGQLSEINAAQGQVSLPSNRQAGQISHYKPGRIYEE